MVFKAKRDGFRWYISTFVLVVYSAVSGLIYFTEGDKTPIFVLGAIWLFISILIIWILPTTTHYTFLDDHLLCQSMGFKKRIYYKTFNKIESANGLYAGWKMSTSWHCLLLRYNKYDELLISPADEKGFIAQFESKKASLVQA
jgi:hypothetical protein